MSNRVPAVICLPRRDENTRLVELHMEALAAQAQASANVGISRINKHDTAAHVGTMQDELGGAQWDADRARREHHEARTREYAADDAVKAAKAALDEARGESV